VHGKVRARALICNCDRAHIRERRQKIFKVRRVTPAGCIGDEYGNRQTDLV
jgi:hypothetical protein